MNRVSPFQHPAPRKNRHLFAGVLLCALVVLFSLAAKVSLYNVHSSSMQGIAKLKAFKGELPSASQAADVAQIVPFSAPVLAILATMLLSLAQKERVASSQGQLLLARAPFRRLRTARPPPRR